MLSDLIERLKAAEEGSREIDVRIEITRRGLLKALAAGTVVVASPGWLAGSAIGDQPVLVPGYTTNLDAALALVPEGWRIAFVTESPFEDEARPWRVLLQHRQFGQCEGEAPTFALALCIAALTAREQSQ